MGGARSSRARSDRLGPVREIGDRASLACVRIARPFVLVPWIALGLLARVALGPESPVPADGLEVEALSEPALCGAHACGCPHEAVPASCCCADERVSPPPRAVRVRVTAELPAPVLVAGAERALADAVLESPECSGTKPGRSAARGASTPRVALTAPAVALVAAEGVEWVPRSASGPPFDLGTEPPTPPPRGIGRG